MLKLRKVELLGFKSFFEKTPITFSGSGITCIVGPNGCGKSNVVDAISWVLGEQSHKMLRAERMSDCIFNGTAKRPPLGLAEVTLTLVDPELSEAVAKVIDGQMDDAANADGSATATCRSKRRPSPRLGRGRRHACRHRRRARRNPAEDYRQQQAAQEARRRKARDLDAPRRNRSRPPALSLGPERIPDQRPRGAPARRAGNLHGHRPRARTATPSSSRAASARS